MSSTKRIIDLQTTSSVGSDDYVMLDGATNGTKKYPLKDILDAIEDVEQGTSLADGAVGTSALAAGAVTNAKVATDAVATANIQNGAVTLAKIAAGSDATTAASGLMSSADKTKLNAFEDASHYALKSEIAGAYIYRGSVANESGLPTSNVHVGDVYNIIAASSYGGPGANVAWNGSAWDTLGETFELGDGSVTTAKLNGGAVTTAKLADGSVTTVKLDTGAVTEPKIGTGAVTTNKLGTGVVTTEKINDGAVTTTKLATSSVTTAKIVDNGVTADKLTTNAVTTTKIADGNVTAVKLDTNSVTTAKIADGAVTNAKIGSEAVTNGKLATNAVATTNVQNGAITTAKIADSAVTTAKLGVGAVTNAKVATDAIATANIQDDSVTTDKLADAAVTFDKLDDEIVETLDFKADIDGYYAQMTVGSADNLTARGDAVEAEFMYRTSGGIADIESGHATIDSIKGNTVRWNQLVSGNQPSATTYGVTSDIVNGVIHVNGTFNVDNASYFRQLFGNARFTPGHKMLVKIIDYVAGESHTGNAIYLKDNYYNKKQFNGDGSVIITLESNTLRLTTCGANTAVTYDVAFKANIFDLTQMFGAGNEPSTVAEFEAMYPEPYYAYDAGSLKSVSMTGIETTGFNQWDEEWELGGFNTSTGNKASVSGSIRSTNMVPVMPSTQYHMLVPHTSVVNGFAVVLFYGVDGAYLNSYIQAASNGSVFTTPSDAYYLTFYVSTQYGTTYKNDICINLSWSGRRNGEYEEYWKAERAIAASTYFPTGIKKAGNAYDELTGPEAIIRVGEVDLGTLTWARNNTNTENVYRMSAADLVNSIKKPADNDTVANVKCVKYDTTTATLTYRGTTGISVSSTGTIYIYDSAYNASDSATSFKAAMSGVMLYYELATPTTTPIDPPLNLTYKVDDWGTEKVMIPDGTVSAVPTFDIIYGMNAVDTIRRLPDLYAGKAETEAALDTKANIDGYYQQLTAGAADNLTGRGDATGGEYLFRTTAGTASVSDEGVATVKSIKGRTLRWNQLVGAGTSNRTGYGISMVPNQDTSWTVSGTVSENPGQPYLDVSTWSEAKRTQVFIPNHKVLVKVYDTVRNASERFAYGVFTSGGFGYSEITTTNPKIVTITDVPTGVYLRVNTTGYAGQTVSGTVAWQVFDLTAMFGAGNEPSTVAEFNALYPLPCYTYDTGTLLPVNMTGIETTGFNAWDGTFKSGNQHFDHVTGVFDSVGGWACTDKIPAFPDTVYYVRADLASGSTSNIIVGCWDAGDKYLGYVRYAAWNSTTNATKPNTAYIRAEWTSVASVTNVCVNLSWSGYRNGEYEPYWSNQRLVPAGTLHSAGSVYDELTETERIERINAITIDATNGTSGITVVNTGNENLKAFVFDNGAWNRMTNNAPRPSKASAGAVTCDKLPTRGGYNGWTTPNIQLWSDNTADIIFAVAESVSTVADLNAWLASNPLTIHYAMSDADFVTTTYDPPLNLDYRYADFGTERIMVPEGVMSAPPTVEAVYGINATDTIRNLPTDYTSKKSLENLIAALDAHNGTTTTMTWNEGQQAYTFAIADNA